MNRVPKGDRGSASAEFAVALPAFIAVLALGVAALSAGSATVRLQDAAADAARLAARGDASRVASIVAQAVPGASAAVSASDDLVCVTAGAELAFAFVEVPVSARSCALDGGV